MYYVWNKSDVETVTEGKRGKYLTSLLTDDDRSLGVSRKFSENFKENFTNYKRKHNAGLNLSILFLATNNNCCMIQNPLQMVK